MYHRPTTPTKAASVEKEGIRIFECQKSYTQKLKNTSIKKRIDKLKKSILKYHKGIHEAIYTDSKKTSTETSLGAISMVLVSITLGINFNGYIV